MIELSGLFQRDFNFLIFYIWRECFSLSLSLSCDHAFCIVYSEQINIIGSTGKRKAYPARTCGSIEGIFSRCASDDVDIGLCEHCNKKIGIDTGWWDLVSLVERREYIVLTLGYFLEKAHGAKACVYVILFYYILFYHSIRS